VNENRLQVLAHLLPFLTALGWGLLWAGTGYADVAAHDTLLAINGTHLYVHSEGVGDALVIVHGGPVLDHGYLVEPLRPLAEGRRLVFYDQRLSGRSDGVVDSASVSLAAFVADLEGIRGALGLARIDLLGHSWGGLLAMLYAVEHPGRVRSLVLVSPIPPSAALWREEQAAAGASVAVEDTVGMGALRSSADFRAGRPAAIERMLQLSFRGQVHDPTLADSLHFYIAEDYLQRSRRFGYLIGELTSFDLLPALQELTIPTLVVHGSEEPGAGAVARAIREAMSRTEIEVIADAGHFAFIERPEVFRNVLRSFLERVDPAGRPEKVER
jgi:proline iminopeptidase